MPIKFLVLGGGGLGFFEAVGGGGVEVPIVFLWAWGFFSENSRRLWLFPGSVRGFSGKTPGKSGKIAGKCSRISGTGKGKPAGNLGCGDVDTAGNLGSTLPGPCPHLPCGVFFEIDSSSLLEFFCFSDIF